MSNTHFIPPPPGDTDALAHYLDGLSDRILNGFVPAATALVALKRINGCMAKLCHKHGITVRDDGVAYSSGPPAGPMVVEEPDDIA